MKFVGRYQGSSFSELLEVDYPQLRPGWEGLGRALELSPVPHGTTVLSFKYAEGVMVAGDRLVTEGHRVASRDVQKVYHTVAVGNGSDGIEIDGVQPKSISSCVPRRERVARPTRWMATTKAAVRRSIFRSCVTSRTLA